MGKPTKSFALWIAGYILRGLFAAVIFAVCALMLWRVFIAARVPSKLQRLAPNAVLSDAYREGGNHLTLWTQEEASVTRGEKNAGYFGVPRFVFVDGADQVQVVFRYNNGTLKSIRDDFSLDAVPPRGTEIFDLTLVTVTDTTPEDKSDNVDGDESLVKSRLAPTTCEVSTTLLYTYYLVTFDGVSTADDVIAIFLDVYYEGAIDYDAEALGTLRLYHCESERIAVELSKKEQKALDAFGK